MTARAPVPPPSSGKPTPPPPPPKAGPAPTGWAAAIGRELRGQDNAATRNPIFGVQQRVRLYGLEEASQWEWRNPDDDWDLASPEEAARLDAVMEAWDDPAPWVRRYYEDRWEFVTACLTRKGCEEYIAANGHNLTDPRIYVYGGYRNAEWEAMRAFFLAAAGASDA